MSRSISRRAILAAPLWLAACRGASAPVLRVGALTGPARATLEASNALVGAPYTILWSSFSTGQDLLEAMAADAVDVGTTGDASFQFGFQAGKPIKTVQAQRAEDVAGASGVLVPKGSTIHGPADLKGRRIAVPRGSAGHLLVLRALAKAGLSPSDVDWAFLSPAEGKAALAAGAVDGWATWPPFIGTALLHDPVRLGVDGLGLVRNYLLQVASERAIAERRPLLKDFLARVARAAAWTNDHPGVAAKALAETTGAPEDVARYTVDRQHWRPAPLDEDFLVYQAGLAATFRGAGALAAGRPVQQAFLSL
ncbi:ABC transporter substrate-binding protein [Caulobacter soli]|uniref:ABC transporter substrate-binding protein n=1 Tax=Caulobacter soli TaxID=2708539 RepID=UPI0013EE11BF|nr:ABC transporter substrate-binding protein [Caulobacter soli]